MQVLDVINSIEDQLKFSKPDGKKNHKRDSTRTVILLRVGVEIQESYPCGPEKITFRQYRTEHPESYAKAIDAIAYAIKNHNVLI